MAGISMSARQHAGHLVRLAVHADVAPHDRPVGAEVGRPHAVGEDRELVGAGLGVGVRETTADERLAAQGGEERRRDRQPAQLLGLPVRGQVHGAEGEERRVLDRGRLALAIEIVRNRDARLRQPHQRIAVPDEDETIGGGVRQRPQQNLIQQAENGGVGADAQRQRQHGDEGEDGLLAQRPQRVPDVLHPAPEGLDETARKRL